MAKYFDVDRFKLSLMTEINLCEEWKKRLSEGEGLSIPDIMRTTYYSVIADLDNLPAADVEEVRHGEWIEELIDRKYYKERGLRCSACGEPVVEAFVWAVLGDLDKQYFKYCPNCGAKMNSEKTE